MKRVEEHDNDRGNAVSSTCTVSKGSAHIGDRVRIVQHLRTLVDSLPASEMEDHKLTVPWIERFSTTPLRTELALLTFSQLTHLCSLSTCERDRHVELFLKRWSGVPPGHLSKLRHGSEQLARDYLAAQGTQQKAERSTRRFV